MMAWRIEALTQDHLDGCARPLVSTFDEEPWNEHWTPETARKELDCTMNTPGFLGLVYAEVAEFAAGYREYDEDGESFYLRTMCVRPDSQGKGVGSKLLRRLKETLTGMDVHSIYLHTDKGAQAETFYEKYGHEVSPDDRVVVHEW